MDEIDEALPLDLLERLFTLGTLLMVLALLVLAVEIDLLALGRCSRGVEDEVKEEVLLGTRTFRSKIEVMCRTLLCSKTASFCI